MADGSHHLVAGVIGGVVTTLMLAPLDLIKVRFQVQDGALHAIRYRSVWGAARAIVAEEGLRGLYRGVVPACWGAGASWGLYFFFYERCKRRLLANREGGSAGGGGRGGALAPGQHMYAAWEGGTLTALLTNPLWLVKTRMQLQEAAPAAAGAGPGAGAGTAAGAGVGGLRAAASSAAATPYRGMAHALRTIVAEEGVTALYKGITPALFLVSHGMIQFAMYEELKAAAAVHGASSGAAAATFLFAAGAVSKAVATTVTYPYQVVKARLQQRLAGTAAAGAYTGFLDVVRKTWAAEGAAGFYKGFAANILRVAPQSAITLVVYEYARRGLDAMHPPPPRL